jgi:hypothetical protein
MKIGQFRKKNPFMEVRQMKSQDAYKKEIVNTKVKLSLPLNKYHIMKTCWGSGCIAPLILELGIRWR